jgi:hypothetical protein
LSEIRKRPNAVPVRGLCLTIGLCLALALPSAAAASRCHSRVKSTSYFIDVRGTHGYSVQIESNDAGGVVLTAEKPRGGRVALYAVRGVSKVNRLEATFGNLGRVALHVRYPKRTLFDSEPVLLEGRLAFKGEEGFTSVSLHRVRGAAFNRFGAICKPPLHEREARASLSSGPKAETFVAAAEKGPRQSVLMRLQASDPPNSDGDVGDFIVVILQESREGMRIERAVDVSASEANLETMVQAAAFTGSISPPPPFRGTATFSRDPASLTMWSGDLSVSLPGARDVPLTGGGFSAVACGLRPGSAEATSERSCDREVEELLEEKLLFPFFF